MIEESKISRFFRKIREFLFGPKEVDKRQSDELKQKMCFKAKASGMCNNYCQNCAWRIDD